MGLWMMLLACGENQTPYAPYEREASDLCIPNLDGQLEASEFPLTVAGDADYWIAEDVSVAYRLGADDQGTPIWTFAEVVDTATEQTLTVQSIQQIGETWYGSLFPSAEWVIANDQDQTTVGLYALDESALWMFGLVSPGDQDANRIVYQTEVPLLRFPLQEGDQYTSEGTVEAGVNNGLPFSGTHRYTVSVGARGELWLPSLRFTDVYRVDTQFEVIPTIGDAFGVRQRSFYSECFGEIVRLQSAINESEVAFTNVAEIRILSVP